MKARVLSIVAVLATALAVASGAQAAALTLSTSGSPGPWLGSGANYQSWHDIYCEGGYWHSPPYNRFFVVAPQNIGRSPSYANYLQDIYMQVELQWSQDATTWYVYERRTWQKRAAIRPGFHALFAQEAFDVSQWRDLYWRTRVEFRWYVAGTSTWIGTAIDGFTQSGIMRQYAADTATFTPTGEGVCRLR